MGWKIEISEFAAKQFKKLDKHIAKKILDYLKERLKDDPKAHGKALLDNLSGLWRYRVGDYRIICEIKNNHLIILVLRLGHRKEIYQKKNK